MWAIIGDKSDLHEQQQSVLIPIPVADETGFIDFTVTDQAGNSASDGPGRDTEGSNTHRILEGLSRSGSIRGIEQTGFGPRHFCRTKRCDLRRVSEAKQEQLSNQKLSGTVKASDVQRSSIQ